MHGLTGFQRDCLYVIAGLENPNGLAIKDELESFYHGDINHGRLYPNLDELVDQGVIEKGHIDKRSNSYSVTERGIQLLEERRRWEEEVMAEAAEPPTP